MPGPEVLWGSKLETCIEGGAYRTSTSVDRVGGGGGGGGNTTSLDPPQSGIMKTGKFPPPPPRGQKEKKMENESTPR